MGRLWFDADRRDSFVIPDEVTLPAGPRFLRNLAGDRRGFVEGDLASYAVDRDTAEAHVRAWLEESYGRARAAFERGLGGASSLPESLEEGLGVDPARVASDPDLALAALANVGARFMGWVARQEGGRAIGAGLGRALEALAEAARETEE